MEGDLTPSPSGDNLETKMETKITITLPAKTLARLKSLQPAGVLRSEHYRRVLLAGVDAVREAKK